MKFYSQSTNGFYDESVHGARVITVVDPQYTPPDEEPETPIEPPYVDIQNPNSKIPTDAVEISDEQHQALLEGQSKGKVIVLDNGFPVLADPPPPTPEQMAKMYENAVQAKLDQEARARGYSNISTAVSYADEPSVPKFQEDGQKLRAWRSLCWQYAYEQLALVESGEREQPTVEQFIAELPAVAD